MSTTIDNRVLEMRFDNKQFEQGVSTTMSTLDKLKVKLNLKGASQGLDDIGRAAKNVNLNGLNQCIGVVQAKFSALQVAGITAINNITNSAVNAGKRMVKALTLDPITTGFREYETKMNSIQTIMSNTASKGTTMADVTKVIDELNTYADKTIYNFAEMTRNIGTFTAAGVGLEESATAIKGIANLAAASGSTSQQASTAMYQLSQALAAGTVKLMDWNSVVNAGMGGEKFQNALKQTAREMGIAVDEIIEKEGSFRESLKSGWMSAEVLNTTLKKFTVDGAAEYAKAMGMSAEATKELVDEARNMEDAATKVKTFTQLWDTMKEAAQSGWGKTWELIVGDFEKARDRLSKLSDVFNGFIDKMSDYRNDFIESGLSSGYDILIRKFGTLGVSADKFQNRIKKLSKVNEKTWDEMIEKCGSFDKALQELLNSGELDKSVLKDAIKSLVDELTGASDATEDLAVNMEEYHQIAQKVLQGDFGDGAQRIKALADAGYDYALVQNLVNEALGVSVRHESELTASLTERSSALSTLTDAQKANADSLSQMSDEMLRAKGFTEEQIKALRFLSDEAEQAGKNIEDIIDMMDEDSNVEKIWDTIMNVIKFISEVLTEVGEAWKNIFGDADTTGMEEMINTIYEWSESLTLTEEKAKTFRTVMEGIFAGMDISSKVVWKTFKAGLTLLDSVLKLFGKDIFDLAETIAKLMIKLHDWLNKNTFLVKGLNKISQMIYTVIEGIIRCVKAFLGLKPIKGIIDGIKTGLEHMLKTLIGPFNGGAIDGIIKGITKFFDVIEECIKNMFNGMNADALYEKFFNSITGWFYKLTDRLLVEKTKIKQAMSDFGTNVVQGFQNGIKAGISNAVGCIVDLALAILKSFAAVLGIHSPSTKFFAFAMWCIKGFINGMKAGINLVIDIVNATAEAVNTAWKDIKWDQIPQKFKDGLKKLEGYAKEYYGKFKEKTVEFLGFLKKYDYKPLLSVIPIGAALIMVKKIYDIADILSGGIKKINSLVGKLGDALSGIADIEKSVATNIKSKAIRNMALAIGILVAAVIALTYVKDVDKLGSAVAIVAILAGVMVGLSWAMDKLASASAKFDAKAKKIEFSGMKTTMLSIASSLLILSVVAKILGSMRTDDLIESITAMGVMFMYLGLILAEYAVLSKYSNMSDAESVGKMIQRIAKSMIWMVIVCKLAGMLSPSEMLKGGVFMVAFGIFASAMSNAGQKVKKKHMKQFGKTIRSIVISLGLLVGVCKLVDMLSVEQMLKGAGFMTAFLLFVKVMVMATRIKGEQKIAELGGLLTGISFSLLLMVGICKLAGMLSIADILHGAAFMGVFGILIIALINVAKIGNDQQIAKVGATLLSLTIALGIMAAISILLSLMPISGLAKGIAAIVVLGLILKSMIKELKGAKEADKSIKALAAVIAVMAGSIYILSKIPTDKLISSTLAISGAMLIFGYMLRGLGKVDKKSVLSIILLGGIVAGLTYLIRELTRTGKSDIESAIAIAASVGILLLAMGATLRILNNAKGYSKNAGKNMTQLTAIAGGLVIVISVFSAAADPTKAIAVATATSELLLAMAISLKIIDGVKGISKTARETLINMGVIAGALVTVISIFSGVADPTKAIAVATATSELLLAMAISLKIIDGVKNISKSAMKTLAELGVIAGLLVGLIAYFSSQTDPINAIALATATSELLLAMAYSLEIIDGVKDISTSAQITIAELALIAAGLMGLLSEFSNDEVDTQAAISIATGVSELLLAISTSAKILSLIGPAIPGAISGAGQFVTLVLAIGLIIGAIGGIIAEIPGSLEFLQNAIPILSALGQGIGEFLGGLVGGAFGGLVGGTLEAISAALPGVGENIKKFVGHIKKASDKAKDIKSDGFESIKKIAKTIGEVAEASLDITIATIFNGFVSPLQTFAKDVETLCGAMEDISIAADGMNVKEEAIDKIVKIAQKFVELQNGVEPMDGVVQWWKGKDDLGTFGENIGTFFEELNKAIWFINSMDQINEDKFEMAIKACEKLQDLQHGNYEINSILAFWKEKTDLGSFGTNIRKFFVQINEAVSSLNETDEIDENKLNVVISTCERLQDLQNGVDKIGGLAAFLGGKDDLKTFGENIAAFFAAMNMAFEALQTVTVEEEDVDKAIGAAEKITDLEKRMKETLGDKVNFNGVEDIGKALEDFAGGFETLVTSLDEIDIDTDKIDTAINAADKIVELQKRLPKEKDTKDIVSLSEFSKQIEDFGSALSSMCGQLSNDYINMEQVNVAIESAKKVRSLLISLKDLTGEGITEGTTAFTGVGTGFFGPDGLLHSIGVAIGDFGEEIADIDPIQMASATMSALRVKDLLIGLAEVDVTNAEKLTVIEQLGTTLSDYSTRIAEIDTAKIDESITNLIKLKNFITSLVGLDNSGISSFSTGVQNIASINMEALYQAFTSNVPKFALIGSDIIMQINTGMTTQLPVLNTTVVAIMATISTWFDGKTDVLHTVGMGIVLGLKGGIEAGATAVSTALQSVMTNLAVAASSNLDQFKMAGTEIVGNITAGINDDADKARSAITDIMEGCLEKISDKNESFYEKGQKLSSKIKSGIENKADSIKKAVEDAVKAAGEAIRLSYSTFKTNGEYLGEGLVQGINAKKPAVYAAGYALGKEAVRGEKDGQNSHSPSKDTEKAGKWLGEGLIIGIKAMYNKVNRAGHNMGSSVTSSISKAVSKVSTMMNSDLDVQPTISPVMDLNNVKNGIASINRMLDGDRRISVMSDLNGINRSMYERIQNGQNHDIIVAINKLRKDVNALERPSYNINGITYDDGSNITQAVESLIRAARIEGRI